MSLGWSARCQIIHSSKTYQIEGDARDLSSIRRVPSEQRFFCRSASTSDSIQVADGRRTLLQSCDHEGGRQDFARRVHSAREDPL